ncbi:hypothetical protein REPUB_Repub16aG0113300 [Reevesia pubescens]
MGQPHSMLLPPIIPIPIRGLIPIDPKPDRKPQPGDHIYSERCGGIYVGNDMVIHLQGPAKKIGPSPPCSKCGDKRVCNGEIIKTCLDCFLDGHSLQIYDYGVPIVHFNMRRRGTCSVHHSKPPHEVIKIATDFLEGNNGFGSYDLFANNCEDFAVYCKTGSALSLQVIGHIEKASLVVGPIGSVAAGAYGLAKVITDVQRRR